MRWNTRCILFSLVTIVVVVVAMLVGWLSANRKSLSIYPPIDLGTAYSFAVLAASTVTNTGKTVVIGDIGLSPGASVTGFPPGTTTTTIHIANNNAVQAQVDLSTAYNAAVLVSSFSIPADLSDTVLFPGTYSTTGDGFRIHSGRLTLNSLGDANAVFLFQTTVLLTAPSTTVVLMNQTQACNVVWQVSNSVVLGANSSMVGTIMARGSITSAFDVSVHGRLLSLNGAITLDATKIIVAYDRSTSERNVQPMSATLA